MTFPVTTLYAATLGLLLIILSDLVTRSRRRSQVSLGHGGDPMLERTMRAHGNFVEYVPLGLILLALIEVKHPELWVVHLFGILLLAGRLLHALWHDLARWNHFRSLLGNGPDLADDSQCLPGQLVAHGKITFSSSLRSSQ